jgi:maltooligosyltrehalose trehalohydrolase
MFMGDEYGETRPFQYFIDHSDQQLISAVRHGRKQEFSAFDWQGELPDPYSTETYETATLEIAPHLSEEQQALHALTRELIDTRKRLQLGPGAREERDVVELNDEKIVVMLRLGSAAVFNFNEHAQTTALPLPRGDWNKLVSTASTEWRGPGDDIPHTLTSPGNVRLTIPPTSAVLFVGAQEAA